MHVGFYFLFFRVGMGVKVTLDTIQDGRRDLSVLLYYY